MQFVPDGPEIPDVLVSAQEQGTVLFVCGAGASMTAGLPSFRRLAQSVYCRLGEDWNLHHAEREVMRKNGQLAGQYDRMLRSLERRLAASDVRGERDHQDVWGARDGKQSAKSRPGGAEAKSEPNQSLKLFCLPAPQTS